MNYFHALILGIIEGLTEFLPVSSTFHLIITSKILGLASSDFIKMFEVVIQSGAIFALVFIYLKTLFSNKKLFINVMSSFVPTAIVGFVLHKIIKTIFFESNILMLGMFVGIGLLFLLVEKLNLNLSKNIESLTIKQAIMIGLAQSLSVIPGVSRAGSVIVAMMLMGYKRNESAKYTFLLSLPTIFAASALDLYQNRELLISLQNGYLLILVGFVVSLIVAYLVVKWFLQYLSNHTLAIFGWYRLIMALILVIFKVLP
ncbi:MAG: undecaprenyl-diphosphate phosphatase [Microgenomates group bacterium]